MVMTRILRFVAFVSTGAALFASLSIGFYQDRLVTFLLKRKEAEATHSLSGRLNKVRVDLKLQPVEMHNFVQIGCTFSDVFRAVAGENPQDDTRSR